MEQNSLAVMHWSGGKDSSLALYQTLYSSQWKIDCLLTTINESYGRIAMHGVRESLLEKQAEAIGIPLRKLYLPVMPSMEVYEGRMRETLLDLKEKGVNTSIYGDIFLEDLRKYRENQLEQLGLQAAFPVWGKPTLQLVREFIEKGFKAVAVCVNARLLGESFAGRELDEAFLNDLPASVDPCGENGEFHTFVYDGPIFKHPVPFTRGKVVYRDYAKANPDSNAPVPDSAFWYCDLV